MLKVDRAVAESIAKPGTDKDNPGGFRHIPALDGIRGLAILLVLIDHLFWANSASGSKLLELIGELREATYCGVNLFFALSGFLITGILLDTLEIPHFFRTFYVRRSLRIFPLYYGFLIVLLLLTKPLHFVWSGWQYFFLTYTTNLALWRGGSPLNLSFFNIAHFWSLQVEEQFYLFWPVIVFRVRKVQSLIRISLGLCGIIFAIRVFLVAMRGHVGFNNIFLPYSPTFSCADNILFGCALCALLRSRWRDTVIRFVPRVLPVSALCLLGVFIENHGLDFTTSWVMPTIGFSLLGISATCIIAMTLVSGSRTQGFFENSVLRFFGRFSYGIYVFHYSLDGAFTAPLRAYFNAHFHSKALSVVAAALLVGLLSVLVALVSYRFYENPFLKLKRFFSYN